MSLFLGVDGGQSGTIALIADEHGEVLGRGTAGPCNHVGSTEAAAKLARVVTECVADAWREAQLGGTVSFRAACFGMSGGPDDKQPILAAAISSELWKVTNDAEIALTGALEGEPGVIVIAGTGSIALGRGANDQLVRAGGWGYVFGDEGSAFDIVRQALRACLRAEEGWGAASKRLSDLFLVNTGCVDLNGVLHVFYTPEWPRSRIATLAAEVDRCAGEGDDMAAQILRNASQSLALFAQAVSRRIQPEGGNVCSYAGGVFSSKIVLQHFRSLLDLSECTVKEPAFGPACGALLEAFRLAQEKPNLNKLLSSTFRHE